jgi:hypothetical protein
VLLRVWATVRAKLEYVRGLDLAMLLRHWLGHRQLRIDKDDDLTG